MKDEIENATYTRLAQQVTSRGPWQQTASGYGFFPSDPRAEDVRIEDIAAALSRTCRYAGHLKRTVEHYSVAQHALHISQWMEEDGWAADACYAGLHHDSEEAYIGDIISQVKWSVPELRPFAHRVTLAVREALNITISPSLEKSVKYYDFLALSTERRDLLSPNLTQHSWGDLPPPRPKRLIPMSQPAVHLLFLERHFELWKELGYDE